MLSFRERGGSIDLEALGFLEPDAKAIGRLMMHPFGYVFVVGPADSARDGTLAGMLDRVRDRGLHVVAIEARGLPPSAGVNQIPVEPGTDMDYADALGHVLQHDPDVILVGNSSRPATAILGLQAALMGKLVLTAGVGSTAVEAIAWLMDAGTPTYVLAPALLGVVAQRRVPAICDSCRRQIPTSRLLEQQLEAAGVQIRGPFFEAKGCKTCGESGRKGQVMLYELLLSDARLRGAIHRGASREELQRVAIAGGMKPRCQHALHLAQQGVVSASTLEQELALWLAVGVPTS